MNHRAVVTVATGHYVRGAQRLASILESQRERGIFWFGQLPSHWPSHQDVPYAFKAYALKDAESLGATTLLWADACIRPVASLRPIWERIEKDGYWFSRNGWTNDQWTADSAYPDLFPLQYPGFPEVARSLNSKIEHVVATSFGIDLTHSKGRAFLDEYFRLASTTKAFCGPWRNSFSTPSDPAPRTAICGPQSTLGHRHDQTAASVIAWRLGFNLTSPPDIFTYPDASKPTDPRTIILADGAY